MKSRPAPNQGVQPDHLKPNVVLRGSIFPEPVQVIVAVPMGESVKLIGKGLTTNQVYEPILNLEQLSQLRATPEKEPFDGEPLKFRVGVEALRLGLAHEYDPYFSLAIARVDPLPHQLEAIYDYSTCVTSGKQMSIVIAESLSSRGFCGYFDLNSTNCRLCRFEIASIPGILGIPAPIS